MLKLLCRNHQALDKQKNTLITTGVAKLNVAKCVTVHGIRPTARKFGIHASTVRGMMKSYKSGDAEVGLSLPEKARSTKTLLPEDMDKKVVSMIEYESIWYRCDIWYCNLGYIKNYSWLLKEHGVRMYTTCKQPVTPGFLKEVDFTFYRAIDDTVKAYAIPPELILNMDQTPLPFFLKPVSRAKRREGGI